MTESEQTKTQTIKVQGATLDEARRDARSRIPTAWYTHSERVLSDGRGGTSTAKGDTEDAAQKAAAGALPANAIDPKPTTRQKAESQFVTVDAETPDEARAKAVGVVGGREPIACGCAIVRPGRSGFLGIGRRVPQFKVDVWRPAFVDLTYRTPAVIELVVGDAPPPRAPARSGLTCDLCNVTISAGGKVYSADEMRRAADAGLRPSSSPVGNRPGVTGAEVAAFLGLSTADVDGPWLRRVRTDRTDWSLCSRCVDIMNKHLK